MWQDMQQKWRELAPSKRRMILIMASATLLTLATSTVVLKSRGAMSVLYAGLGPTETREIAAELSRQGYDYKISEDETTISIPTRDEPRARMRLASAGLPRSSPEKGWEIFGEGGLAVTKPQQQAMQIRALQGELSRSIASLDSVSKAAVHIALKQDSPFLAEEQPAKAAVLLHLKPGQSIDREQALAVAHLVAKSVPDLETAQITLMDEKGNLLFSDNVARGSSEADGARKFEKEIERRVQSQLDMTFGLGKALVRATAEVATQRSETRRTTYTPAAGLREGLPGKELQETESYDGGATPRVGGVPGTGGNLFNEAERFGTGTGRGGNYNRSKLERDFKVNEEQQILVQPGGGIERLTLGIFVDESLQSSLTKIETVARNAAGVDEQRGDSISVQAVKFSGSATDAFTGSSRLEMVKTIARLILNCLALIIGLLTLRSIVAALKPVPEPVEVVPEAVKELLQAQSAARPALTGLNDFEPVPMLTGASSYAPAGMADEDDAAVPPLSGRPSLSGLTGVAARSDDDEAPGPGLTGAGNLTGAGSLAGRAVGLTGRLTVPGLDSRLFEAADDAGLDPDVVTLRTGPTPEEMVGRVEQTEIDDIAEVLRHWLEGELDEQPAEV